VTCGERKRWQRRKERGKKGRVEEEGTRKGRMDKKGIDEKGGGTRK
jgi:hypothetical protein